MKTTSVLAVGFVPNRDWCSRQLVERPYGRTV